MLTNERMAELLKLIPVSSKAGIRPDFADITPFLLEFLKEYEQSKWVKFDVNDKSTWPPEGEDVLVAGEGSFRSVDEFSRKTFNWYGFVHPHYYKYWQPLPKLQKGFKK